MPPIHFIQTNSMFKGFSVEHRHVLREDANSEPNLPPPVLFFSPQPLSTVVLWEGGEYSHRAVYVLLNLGPTGTPLFGLLLTTNERNIRPVFRV